MSDIRKKPDAPDYPLEGTVRADTSSALKALGDPVRRQIVEVLMDRAATTTELAVALERPRGTVDHHLKVLANAGLVRVVRTRKVRALTENYWGRTARTIIFDYGDKESSPFAPFLRDAVEETERVTDWSQPSQITLRHARITPERAQEFVDRIEELALEFSATERGGSTVFGLLLALYPTDQPTLPPLNGEVAATMDSDDGRQR